MKKSPSRSALAAVSIACILILAACNSAPSLRYITISPKTATIAVTTTQQYTATAYYSDGSTKDGTGLVSWSSSDTSVATINGSGVATGVATGTVTITGSAAGTSGDTATLTVNQPFTSIAVNCTPNPVGLGGTSSCTALGNPGATDITTQVTWNSATPTVATIPATAPASPAVATAVAVGTTTISATLNSINSNNFTLTVTSPLPVSIKITPAPSSAAIGGSVNFTAQEVWSDSTLHTPSGTVAWTSGTTTVATVLANTTTSSVAAATALATGSSVITATEGALTPGTSTLTVVAGVTNFAYVVNGANPGSGLGYFQVSAAGTTPLTNYQTVALANSLAPFGVAVHPAGSLLYVVDFNSNLHVFTLTAGVPSEVGAVTVVGGGGQNHVAIDPYGRFVYVTDDTSNTIYGFSIDQTSTPDPGALTNIAGGTNALVTGGSLNAPEDIVIDPTGKYLYVTNSGSDTVSGYQIQADGTLVAIAGSPFATGSIPFFESFDPSGKHLFVADSGEDTVAVFTLGTGGALGTATITTIPGATSVGNVAIAPAGNFIYVADEGTANGAVSVFALSGATIATGTVISTGVTGVEPTAMNIDASGVLLTVNNAADSPNGTISLFQITPSTGAITPVSPTAAPTVTVGGDPWWAVFSNAVSAPAAGTVTGGTKN